MKKNVGNTDMIVRFILAALLVLVYFLFPVGKLTGLIFIVLAIILVVTSLIRFCPLYYIFRANTLEKKKE